MLQRRLVALIRIFGQAPLHDGRHRRRHIPARPAKGGRFRLYVLTEHRQRRFGGEGQLTGEHLVEHDAHGVDVGANVRSDALGLLRGHVVGRAHDGSGAGQGGEVGSPRQTWCAICTARSMGKRPSASITWWRLSARYSMAMKWFSPSCPTS